MNFVGLLSISFLPVVIFGGSAGYIYNNCNMDVCVQFTGNGFVLRDLIKNDEYKNNITFVLKPNTGNFLESIRSVVDGDLPSIAVSFADQCDQDADDCVSLAPFNWVTVSNTGVFGITQGKLNGCFLGGMSLKNRVKISDEKWALFEKEACKAHFVVVINNN